MSEGFYEPNSQKALFGNMLLWVVGVLVVIGVISAVFFGIRWVTAPAKGKLQAREQINSGSFRIEAYNRFFDRCVSVQTLDQALNQSYSDLKTASADDKERIQINIGAQMNSRNDAANQYNADTHKDYTVGQFKASNLVYQIPNYTKGQVTQCTTD